MKNGKYQNDYRVFGSKFIAALLALVLMMTCIVSGTVAWLTDTTDEVKNTFTVGNINIDLDESDDLDLKMIPGWTIVKDPVATVLQKSEDCWLFVEVVETDGGYKENGDDKTISFDSFISYKVNTDATTTVVDGVTHGGWIAGEGNGTEKNGVPVGVYFRKVDKSDADQEFAILGSGSYTDPMGTTDVTTDDVTVTWGNNQVAVKPSVTKEMMNAMSTANAKLPKLTFTAYAVQLYKSNGVEFTPAEAWEKIATPTP